MHHDGFLAPQAYLSSTSLGSYHFLPGGGVLFWGKNFWNRSEGVGQIFFQGAKMGATFFFLRGHRGANLFLLVPPQTNGQPLPVKKDSFLRMSGHLQLSADCFHWAKVSLLDACP